MSEEKWVKAFKGFNRDMTCNPSGNKPFQYAEGESYEEPDCNLCNSGFHACEMPLDVFNYYPPASSVYHAVELGNVSDKRDDDTKICGTKIKIGSWLNIANLIKAQFEYVKNHCTNENNAYAGKPATARGTVTVGANGVGTVRGNNVKIRGGLGALLVAAEENQDSCDVDTWATAIVDGETIKPDTWYCVKNGKFVEV